MQIGNRTSATMAEAAVEETVTMKARIRRFFTPAVLAATIPATAVLAHAPQQTQTAPSAQPTRPSADTLARLL